MSNTDEIRWQQRLETFSKTLLQLESACKQDEYSDLERAGLIQIFNFTFELAWKTLKDLLFLEGHVEQTPRSVIRRSFEVEYLLETDSEILLDALNKRNLLSHLYEEEVAKQALELIKGTYFPVIQRVCNSLREIQNG